MSDQQAAFEAWARQDWKEVDLGLLANGEYRVNNVRDMWRAWQGAYSEGYAEGFDAAMERMEGAA